MSHASHRPPAPHRYLPVGDSMTVGRAGDHTWRYRLWRHLKATATAPFALVGPRTALYGGGEHADPAFPEEARGHLAGWGEGWQHLAPLVGDAVRDHRADTLLVSLGLIDLGFYTDAAQTTVNVHRFVDGARAANPRVRMVLLPVLPNIRAASDAPFAAEVAHFNELLAKTVASLTTPASPLLLTPPPPWSLPTHTYDGTHPTPAGDHHLAAAFANTLHTHWHTCAPYPAGC
ncbi:GDSL-type esterase/lipase family protein [Streptomyces sp. NPDC060194]|uniref:GDSL-type esterase/lipase family protein n=1 Tax=Streptomyces sp. NPDC060194 TaxID=3347069 RepID=UPI00364C7D29